MSVANLIGTSAETLKDATGEVNKEFVPLPSGCYKGKVKGIYTYENNFGDTAMRYIVIVKDKDGQEHNLEFTKDISSKLKDKSDNKGYANRFKMFMYAANAKDDDLSKKEAAGKLNSFGKEYEYDEILGMVGKPLLAEVRLRDDVNKPDGANFKLSNALVGVLALDGTDSTGENKQEAFEKKCLDTPIETYEGYVKKEKAKTSAQAATTNNDIEDEDF